jgi:hypothetical protein
MAITREFFADPIAIEDCCDPEDPSHQWRVVVVSMHAPIAEIIAAKSKWHRRMFERLGQENVGRYTICVVP